MEHGGCTIDAPKLIRGPGRKGKDSPVSHFVYILASKRNGTLYVGVTSDLGKRVWQHGQGVVEGFTREYEVKRLVHAEEFSDLSAAREREHTLKRWRRRWKVALSESENPAWRDLYDDLNR